MEYWSLELQTLHRKFQEDDSKNMFACQQSIGAERFFLKSQRNWFGFFFPLGGSKITCVFKASPETTENLKSQS